MDNRSEHRTDRVTGLVLAVLLFIHIVLLRDSAAFLAVTSAVLLAGAVLRERRVFVPPWLGRSLLLLGVAGSVAIQTGSHPIRLLGEMAGVAGALWLLRPVTPGLGLRVLFCILIVLTATLLQPSPGIGTAFVIGDVVVLVILAEQIHRPPEAALSLWISLLRSLQVVIPVGVVVTLIFWFFPELSLPSIQSITGFSGGMAMNPGGVASLGESHRVALVARFPQSQSIPSAHDLYWRGHVLEKNEGLRWTHDPGRQVRLRSFSDAAAPEGVVTWKYSQDAEASGGILPVLDCGFSVEATRAGQDLVVLDQGASVMTTPETGILKLEVTSTGDRASDPPTPEIADGGVRVPEAVKASHALRRIADKIVSPQRSTEKNLEAAAKYLRESGFTYTTQPGRMSSDDVAGFLVGKRRGFCEHYAAAIANILRLGGVPARIVVGYRGGEWNPWRRTITVRNSEAHAWVEAWDAPSRRWMRFDPTACVAPEITTRFERELDWERWPWYRLAFSYVSAIGDAISEYLDQFFALLEASAAWDLLPPVLLAGLFLAGIVWFARNFRRRRGQSSAELAAGLLAGLERRAARSGRGRRAGETPMAWLARLGAESDRISEMENLRSFAEAYEAGVYRPVGGDPSIATALRVGAKRLRAAWKN